MRRTPLLLAFAGGIVAILVGVLYYNLFPRLMMTPPEHRFELLILPGIVGAACGLVGIGGGLFAARSPRAAVVLLVIAALGGFIMLSPFWLPAALLFGASAVATARAAPPERSPGRAGWCKLAGMALLVLPLGLVLLLGFGEVLGGEFSGVQHFVQAAPLVLLPIVAWRWPRLGGTLLLAGGIGLFVLYLVSMQIRFGPLWAVSNGLIFFAPAIAAGALFLMAGGPPHGERHHLPAA